MGKTVKLPAGAEDFLGDCGWGECEIEEFSADAAFRQYYRLRRGTETRVLMYAPRPSERSEWFVALARHIKSFGLSAPTIHAERLPDGFILLEDLGELQYFSILPDRRNERLLYETATDVLVALHRVEVPANLGAVEIPRYDHARMIAEAGLLLDWHWPELMDGAPPESVRRSYEAAWQAVLPAADYADDRLVQLDYHSPNLMWLPDRQAEARVGILDFQDAMRGPASYDLVSLLQDARRDVGVGIEADMLHRYLTALPSFDADRFRASYAVMGTQRAARILGVFVRLWRRDGKLRYLQHLPRLWRQLDTNLEHPVLAPLRTWFDAHLPVEARRNLALEAV